MSIVNSGIGYGTRALPRRRPVAINIPPQVVYTPKKKVSK